MPILKILKTNSARQLFGFSLGPMVGVFISMLTVPVTTRLVAPEEFGKSALFSLMQAIFNLVALCGMDQSYVRYYNTCDDKHKLLYNSTLIPLIFSALVGILVFILRNQVSYFMFGQYERTIMLLVPFSLPATILSRFAMLSIRMDLRGKLYSALNIANQIINFLLLILFLIFYEKTFRSIVLASLLSSYFNMVIPLLFSNAAFVPKSYFFDKDLFNNLLKYGIPLIPSSILAWILNSFDKISLRLWGTFEELGLYAAAFKMVAIMNIFQNIFATTWSPIAYRWYENKVPNKYFEYAGFLVTSFFSFIFVGVVLFRDIIFLFLGQKYRGTAEIFVFLFFMPLLYSIAEVTGMGIYFSKKTVYTLIVSFVAVIINMLGDFVFVKIQGAVGVAFISFLSYTVWFWLRTLISRKLWFHFSIFPYFISIFLLLFLALSVFLQAGRFIEFCIGGISLLYNAYLFFVSIKYLKDIKNE